MLTLSSYVVFIAYVFVFLHSIRPYFASDLHPIDTDDQTDYHASMIDHRSRLPSR